MSQHRFPVRRGAVVSALAVACLLAGLVPALVSAQGRGAEPVDVLIEFRSAPGPADEALVRAAGGTVRRTFRLVPAIAATLPEPALGGLLASGRVVRIEADGLVHALDHDAELANTWGVARIGAGTVHHGGTTGRFVKVAVIDSGIDYTHPDLGANYAGGYDFVNNDADPMDDNGHGTHVAGTIGALANGVGVVGAAPEVSLYGLKVLGANGSGSWSNIIAALQWTVDNGIPITNNSYGSGSDPGSIVRAAFDNAEAAGVLHVAAAGNSGNCAGRNNSVGFPARYESVIAVAATNQDDVRPCFSSTGPAVELAAPGVSIPSTQMGGGYVSFSGTSMASPHVAGVAALILAAGVMDLNGNGRVNDEVRAILASTADDLGAAGRDNHYGHGLVNAVQAVAAATGGGGGGEEPPPPSGTVIVSSIVYSTSGGRDGKKDLFITVSVVDDAGAPVGGASAAIDVTRDGALYGSASGTTGSNGQVTFKATNAPAGCYATTVTNVTAAGLTWDGATPPNAFCK